MSWSVLSLSFLQAPQLQKDLSQSYEALKQLYNRISGCEISMHEEDQASLGKIYEDKVSTSLAEFSKFLAQNDPSHPVPCTDASSECSSPGSDSCEG